MGVILSLCIEEENFGLFMFGILEKWEFCSFVFLSFLWVDDNKEFIENRKR